MTRLQTKAFLRFRILSSYRSLSGESFKVEHSNEMMGSDLRFTAPKFQLLGIQHSLDPGFSSGSWMFVCFVAGITNKQIARMDPEDYDVKNCFFLKRITLANKKIVSLGSHSTGGCMRGWKAFLKRMGIETVAKNNGEGIIKKLWYRGGV